MTTAKPGPSALTELPEVLAPLIASPHWVVWRWELVKNNEGNDKWTKVPYQSSRPKSKASTKNSATWGEYAMHSGPSNQGGGTPPAGLSGGAGNRMRAGGAGRPGAMRGGDDYLPVDGLTQQRDRARAGPHPGNPGWKEGSSMNRAISLALLAGGGLLVIFGVSASKSLGSDISRFFTGSPTDKAIWMLVAGVVMLVIGLVGLLRGSGAT